MVDCPFFHKGSFKCLQTHYHFCLMAQEFLRRCVTKSNISHPRKRAEDYVSFPTEPVEGWQKRRNIGGIHVVKTLLQPQIEVTVYHHLVVTCHSNNMTILQYICHFGAEHCVCIELSLSVKL